MPHETIHYQSLVHLLCCDWLSVLSMQSLDSCGFPFQLHFQDLVWCSSLSFSTKPWILLWLWLRHPFHHKSDSFVCLFLLVQGICFGLGIHLTVFYFWQSLTFIFSSFSLCLFYYFFQFLDWIICSFIGYLFYFLMWAVIMIQLFHLVSLGYIKQVSECRIFIMQF